MPPMRLNVLCQARVFLFLSPYFYSTVFLKLLNTVFHFWNVAPAQLFFVRMNACAPPMRNVTLFSPARLARSFMRFVKMCNQLLRKFSFLVFFFLVLNGKCPIIADLPPLAQFHPIPPLSSFRFFVFFSPPSSSLPIQRSLSIPNVSPLFKALYSGL